MCVNGALVYTPFWMLFMGLYGGSYEVPLGSLWRRSPSIPFFECPERGLGWNFAHLFGTVFVDPVEPFATQRSTSAWPVKR